MTEETKMLTLTGLCQREQKPLLSQREIFNMKNKTFTDPDPTKPNIPAYTEREGHLQVDCGHFRKSNLLHHYRYGPFLFGPYDVEYRFLDFQVLLKLAQQYQDLIAIVEEQRPNYSCDLTIDTGLSRGNNYNLVTGNLQYLEDIVVMGRIRKQFQRKYPGLKNYLYEDEP